MLYIESKCLSVNVLTKISTDGDFMPIEGFLSISKLLGEGAGLLHDLGKCSHQFQQKLRSSSFAKDDVRHEWISLFLAASLAEGLSWDEAVKAFENMDWDFSDPKHSRNVLIFNEQLKSHLDVVLFCVATHHRLPKREHNSITSCSHVRRDIKAFNNPKIPYTPKTWLLDQVRTFLNTLDRLKPSEDPAANRCMASFVRMALILADQSVSAEWKPFDAEECGSIAYANTYGDERKLNQELSWHLSSVAERTKEMALNLLKRDFPGASEETREAVCRPSSGAFEWQNRTEAFLKKTASQRKDSGHLVFMLAGTGKGKTLASLRAAASLREGQPLRVTTAINLRTLTLQTANAYTRHGINKKDIALLVGDSLSVKLQKASFQNQDEDDIEFSPEAEGDSNLKMPDWLEFYAHKNPKLRHLMMPPIVISTVDFLVAAGEPHRKHHHILASVRIMNSDLILDEVDAYDPAALIAIARLVLEAAKWGRNVIASSATLSKPVAKVIWEAYNHGCLMRKAIEGEYHGFKTVIIDDRLTPSAKDIESIDDFNAFYSGYLRALIDEPMPEPTTIPRLLEVPGKSESSALSAIRAEILRLHSYNHFQDPSTEKRVSIGLIRVARIKSAIALATMLSRMLPDARICCYHSNLPAIHRHLLEERLDHVLTRKGDHPNARLLQDPDMRKAIESIAGEDVIFIVIATPVEEVGRDHDFDWGIIEPSSSQSIVQTAGRINRHRREGKEKPNVSILQYNFQELKRKNALKAVFTAPGLETINHRGSTHPSHDLKDLFDWGALHYVSSAMRFDTKKHLFAAYDDIAIDTHMSTYFKSFLTQDRLWMAKETYTDKHVRLRDEKETIEISPTPDAPGSYRISSREFRQGHIENGGLAAVLPKVENAWLSFDDEYLREIAEKTGLDEREALTVSIPINLNDKSPVAITSELLRRHLSFGFYVEMKE